MTTECTLLGVEGYVDSAKSAALVSALRRSWTATIGGPPGDLEGDLRETRRWFDPVAQGQRLRRELAALDPLPEDLADPQPPFTVAVGTGKWLVTPEGRCALDLLEHLPKDRPGHVITDEQLAPYERRLALLYREWSRHRLRSVVALLAGTTKPLQIPAVGVVIALLVNRSTSDERALTRFVAGPERDVVDKRLLRTCSGFRGHPGAVEARQPS